MAMGARAEGLALVLLLLAAATAGAGATQEDRPLPPSPCPDVFSYEGATVDWDRWYGVVLVATDIPLTGLRLDVWLSSSALALRHNWDGNVTTLDNRRFTILNLYKRIEPGPPKSIRIVVKFDENKEIPVLRAIELNGRRICSDGKDNHEISTSMSGHKSRPGYHEDEASTYHQSPPPSNSKYDFDRTTRRPYETSDDHRNTVSRRPTQDLTGSHEQSRPPPRGKPRPEENQYSPIDESSMHRNNPPRISPEYDQGYRPRPADPEFDSYAPPPAHGHRKPPAAHGGGKLPPGPPEWSGTSPPGRAKPGRRPDASAFAEDDSYRPPPPSRRPALPIEHHRPTGSAEAAVVYEEGEIRAPPRAPTSGGVRTTPPDSGIDVRFNFDAQPLGDFPRHSAEDLERPPSSAERPQRQGNGKDPEWVPPGHRRGGGNGNGNGNGNNNGHGNSGSPPGLSGNRPPGHGGAVPGHNKDKGDTGSNNYNNNNGDNHNSNNNDHNSNNGWGQPARPERPPSTFKPETSTRKHSGSVGGQECGRTLTVAPLITHGQNTSRGQWPWHAALYQNKGADLKYICGGTLIGPKYVITAAHCVTRSTTGRAVDPDTIIAYLGKYHLHRWTNEEGVQQGKVAAIHVHPDYNATDFRGDLALLEFSTALTYTQYVRHVCLWRMEDSNELEHVVKHEGFVVGWGYDEHGELTEELRLATMPIVDQHTCIWSYPEFFSRFTNNMTFCAGYKNGTSACNGDSGGGLVLPRHQGSSKMWYLRGLVSTSVAKEGQRVCNTDHYVVFTDLAKYRNWIARYVY